VTKDEAQLGTRVRTKMAFSGVPLGSEGVIDEFYPGGQMVAWDLPERPLPKPYAAYDGVPALRSGITRDGFGDDELEYLEVVDG